MPLQSNEITRVAKAAVEVVQELGFTCCLFGSAACWYYGMRNRVPNVIAELSKSDWLANGIQHRMYYVDLVVMEDPEEYDTENIKRLIVSRDSNPIPRALNFIGRAHTHALLHCAPARDGSHQGSAAHRGVVLTRVHYVGYLIHGGDLACGGCDVKVIRGSGATWRQWMSRLCARRLDLALRDEVNDRFAVTMNDDVTASPAAHSVWQVGGVGMCRVARP
ncbi:hypothetical protein DFP72DRAFT_848899 [Ephemerocybe angulata]|uniref:Uncharacterized protein n=1 Tax=Ephemerocybe angulata TaxID=980116 RepID=A0A8H6M3W1_9AGAR|nr:hypothetical protein DFP72DRAFT_848899 [Tulosesus angulatus]